MGLIIHIDGGSRGNPGPAGAGVVMRRENGGRVHEAAYFLGRQTSNAAEYLALIHALQRVDRTEAGPISIRSDSELLVRQLTGEYQVKSPSLQPLYEQVQILLLKIPRWTVRHIPREENAEADKLANLAMDRKQTVVLFDVDDDENDAGSPTEAGCDADDALPPASPRGDSSETDLGAVSAGGAPAVRVTLAETRDAEICCAGERLPKSFSVSTTLPGGLCVHAAHALLPSLLAILNTDRAEFAAIPTMTVRCSHRRCRAAFHLSPLRPGNGNPHAAGD